MSWSDLSARQLLKSPLLTMGGMELKSSGKWYVCRSILWTGPFMTLKNKLVTVSDFLIYLSF